MATTFIVNQFLCTTSAIFLDGGSYTKNVMRNASIVATDDTGENYKISYEGSYYTVPVDNVQFTILESWLTQTGRTVKDEWTSLAINYDTYLN